MTALLFCVLIMALFASVPIGVSLLFAVMVYLLLSGNTIYFQMVIPRMFTAVDNFSFLAVPCFILAGNLMVRGGISKRLIKFIMLLLGRTPASLANITVGASAFFGASSGSNAAPVAAIGGIMIPEMHK
jgi:C4-dicarboxylate transporter DctM subunit